MQTTADFLDAVKAKLGVPSDYALAPAIGTTRSMVSRYRNGKDYLSDEMAVKFSEILHLPADYIIACSHAERAKTEGVKEVWQGLAKKLFHAAPIMAGVLVTPGVVAGLRAVQCILCKIVAGSIVRRIPA